MQLERKRRGQVRILDRNSPEYARILLSDPERIVQEAQRRGDDPFLFKSTLELQSKGHEHAPDATPDGLGVKSGTPAIRRGPA